MLHPERHRNLRAAQREQRAEVNRWGAEAAPDEFLGNGQVQ